VDCWTICCTFRPLIDSLSFCFLFSLSWPSSDLHSSFYWHSLLSTVMMRDTVGDGMVQCAKSVLLWVLVVVVSALCYFLIVMVTFQCDSHTAPLNSTKRSQNTQYF
jgi:hypothetical protein